MDDEAGGGGCPVGVFFIFVEQQTHLRCRQDSCYLKGDRKRERD